jgi:hypothetical protein
MQAQHRIDVASILRGRAQGSRRADSSASLVTGLWMYSQNATKLIHTSRGDFGCRSGRNLMRAKEGIMPLGHTWPRR